MRSPLAAPEARRRAHIIAACLTAAAVAAGVTAGLAAAWWLHAAARPVAYCDGRDRVYVTARGQIAVSAYSTSCPPLPGEPGYPEPSYRGDTTPGGSAAPPR